MRSDAARRRQSIITSARHLFAERGGDVPLETVAAESGVGIATLYRNFSSRDHLVRAVIDDIVQQILDVVAEADAAAATDPTSAWTGLIDRLMRTELGALTDGLGVGTSTPTDPGSTGSALAAIQQPALDALDGLLTRLQSGRVIRDDITALGTVAAIATITRPQVATIRAAAPEVPAQLAAAYLEWSLRT
ncbi:AcrR family transcriptional regulator [Microbacterium ginsengiterrae]|uniref:AcrR family transcriptional regulator n=1 Tax=Microbacterium ginsengiterrae TaxID=546115 RepID=A0A7W9CDK5_9MICO|nr:TetR/AcrR family transcriptional regulator [Microbacterium ginsengiterrae]MBB5743640.1 AcrR family transcriptional regulator [Microbacterium ginsengiterrae]